MFPLCFNAGLHRTQLPDAAAAAAAAAAAMASTSKYRKCDQDCMTTKTKMLFAAN